MISSKLSNRLIFFLSLLGLGVSAFLLYEYNLSGPVICPLGNGCDIVRASPYSRFLGVSLPILGLVFYLGMALFAIVRSQKIFNKILAKLQLLGSLAGVAFGIYLTFLEVFVIKAICFWCVASFIISVAILVTVIPFSRKVSDDKRD